MALAKSSFILQYVFLLIIYSDSDQVWFRSDPETIKLTCIIINIHIVNNCLSQVIDIWSSFVNVMLIWLTVETITNLGSSQLSLELIITSADFYS